MPWSMARWRASAPSSRRIAARCCSTPATTCSPPSAPTKSAKTIPSAPCAAASRCWPKDEVLGAEVQAAHGHSGFGVRVGIHTGDVLLGGGVDGEGSIRGLAVNIAARMEQTAPPGGLRISHDTYALVRGLFEVVAQEPMRGQGRGRADPQLARAARRARRPVHRRPRHRGRGDAHGRPRRRARGDPARCSAQVAAERRLAVVTVVAEAGIGKSRLLYEVGALGASSGPSARTCCTAGPGRRPRASPTDCCARSSPDRSASATTTAWRTPAPRSSRASRRCSPPTTAPSWRRPTPTSSAT